MDNKGEIDPDFPLKDYSLHLNQLSSSDPKHTVKVSMMMLYQILLKKKFKKVQY
jgi:hypothetical protein